MRLRISIVSVAAVASALAQEGRVIRCDTPPPTPQQVAQDRFQVRPFDFFYDKMVRTTWTTVIVPVVVHVLLDDDGKGDVTDAVLTEQVKVLSDSFRKHGFTFSIEKVTRTKNSKWYRMGHINNDDDSDAREAKEHLVVDPARNLNLYIALPKPAGLLGWARFPWQLAANPKLDGVVILNSTLPGGSKQGYNQGKTAVHEVGHWLGLYHTFEGGCTGGDEVDDTPAQDTPSEGDCDSQEGNDTCPDSPGLDDYQNFMDYTYDACLVHFTRGQAKRMQLQVMTYRPALVPPETETGEALRVVASSIEALRKVDFATEKLLLEARSQKGKF